jgi:hypothetical protein
MTHRWRILPDDAPRGTCAVLWCLTAAAVFVMVIATIDWLNSELPAQQNVFWGILANAGIPVLIVSIWGLFFRRFAFGSAWIAVTLLTAGILCGGLWHSVEASVHESKSDGAGFAAIAGLFGATAFSFGIIVASSIMYGVYWKRRFRRASQESHAPLTDRSHP